MQQNLFSIRQFRLTKWSFLVYSTTGNAPYIHPSHDSILELWQTFPNVFGLEILTHLELCFNDCIRKMISGFTYWSTT